MQTRTLAAAFNGIIVLLLYISAWGVPSWTVAMIEIALATGASLSTWYALKRATTPAWLTRLAPKRAKARA
jgi:hypothetical protein